MLHTWAEVLDPYRTSTNWGRPSAESIWAPVLVLAIAAAVGAIASVIQQRRPTAAGRLVADAGVALGCIMAAEGLRQYEAITLVDVEHWVRHAGVPALAIAGLLGFAALLRWRATLVRWCSIAFLIGAPFVAITAVRASAIALTTDFTALDPVVPSHFSGGVPGPRVVVLVFDEFDYHMAFEARPADLSLPTFDRLRTGALFATNARPPARATELSMLSYLLGREVTVTRRVSPSEVRVRLAGDTQTVSMAGASTLMGDAARLGAPAALVGVHLPYCRMGFAATLERCTWRPLTLGGLSDGPTGIGRAVMRQLLALVLVGNRVAQIDRLGELDSAAAMAAADPAIRLTFIHLPSPHLPPIWNRKRSRYTVLTFRTSGYFDNLALSDHLLAGLEQRMEAAHVQDSTVLIVTSDHPWRGGPVAGISPGDRVPFIVRMPDGISLQMTETVETIRLRPLVVALLRGDIRTTAQLANWLAPTVPEPARP